MALTSSSWLARLRRLIRPSVVTLLVLGLLFGWVGWQLSQQWFDQPLPTSALQAQQLRVNSGKLKQLQERLETYHHPADAPTAKTKAFAVNS